ncbi:MAG: hypothetical protein HF312_15370 [Ignavibacteria bacterium]|jgi:hypothetical protein|nr:hypothetical protein [Ignavibacteria bacterium]
MAYTRISAVSFIAGEYAALINETKLSPDLTGLSSIIDNAFLAYKPANYETLSTMEVLSADVPGVQALLKFYALNKFASILATRVDLYTDTPSPDAKRSQAFKNVMQLLQMAKAEAIGYGYLSELADEDSGSFQRIVYNTDKVEPRTDSEYA